MTKYDTVLLRIYEKKCIFAADMSLPEEFEHYTRSLMGESLYAAFLDGMKTEAPASIRINPFKTDASTASVLCDAGRVPWCRYGHYLSGRPPFTFDPLFHAGVYYVQEASSMFIDHVIRQTLGTEAASVLDLCAAPGGKSTCAMAALPEGSVMFCNEPIRQRVSVLAENILKFGKDGMVVTNNYAADYRKAGMVFDAVIADVPCSGEGMFRKDAGAIAEWSQANVVKCRNLQRSIVEDIWPCLKPGGIMVYSTCTFNALEDEENAEWIAHELGADFVDIGTEKQWNITGALTGCLPAYRFIPGVSEGEGLFMAVLRKHGDNGTSGMRLSELRQLASKRLKVVTDGVKAPIVKGKQTIPDHSEAMSVVTDNSRYPGIDIGYSDAIAYLRHEAIVLPPDAPRGIVMLRYRGVSLGFAKNLGNRANNLYPQEWRIRSTHIPVDFEDLVKVH